MGANADPRPDARLRRSFVYRKLTVAGARFGEVNGGAAAIAFGDADGEAVRARRMGVADLSVLPRTGFRGAGTADWLVGEGLTVPAESNRAARQDDGALAARLAPGEVLVLDSLAGQGAWPARLEAACADAPRPPETPRGYPVPRADTHAWFLVTGSEAAAMFAKLCAVDLRPKAFAQGAIAQTSVARLNATVIRDDREAAPAYHLLADSASAEYLWDCLLDAVAEFDGGPVGLGAVRDLQARP